MDRNCLDIESRDRGALVTFRRNKTLNAIDGDGVRELNAALTCLDESSEAEVIILTGAGRAFVTGADIA